MGILPTDLYLSLLRWFLGLSIGCSLGLSFAILGNIKPTRTIFKLLNDFFRAIPILGLVPVIQMNFGINEYGKIGLIAWAVMFPVWITVRNALEKSLTNTELTMKATNIGKSNYFRYYTFPKVLGGFLRGVEIAIGIAWLAVVAAEWVGTFTQGFWSGGLGYKMVTGYELNNWKTVYNSLLIFGALGVTTAYLWRLFMYLFFQRSKTFNPLIKEMSTY